MTSKTSYNKSISYRKFIWENIRQRGWLAALSFIALFLVQTVYPTLNIENRLSNFHSDYTWYQEQFPQILNGVQNAPLSFVIVLLAVLCAASGYSYLHQREKSDFFHGFPLKRTQWYEISYYGGLLIFLIPYLFASLCAIAVAAGQKLISTPIFGQCILAVFGGILGFMILYHTAILAMMLTGKLLSGVLASFVLFIYGDLIHSLFYDLSSNFFDTYFGYYKDSPNPFQPYLSPFHMYFGLASRTVYTSDAPAYKLPLFLLISIAILIALWFLARFLYQKRPLEAAENALVYPKSASTIKILIAIPTALFIGLYADSFYYHSDNKRMIICCILSVILLCGIIEFIYTQDLRQICNRKYSSLLSILGVMGILGVLQFDVFGYDTWLPETDKLESMAFYTDAFETYFTYPNSFLDTNTPMGLLNTDEMQQKEFENIYALAQEGILNQKNGITPASVIEDDLRDYINISVRFNKSDEKHIYRTYAVQRSHVLNCLEELCKKDSYRKTLFPVFYLEINDILSITLHDLLSTKSLDLTEEEKKALFVAYQTDVLQTDIHPLQETSPIGSFSFFMKEAEASRPETNASTSQLSQLYLYDTYKNTLELLKQYGYTICTEIKPEDVIQMTLTSYTTEGKETNISDPVFHDESETSIPVTDPVEINNLLDRIAYTSPGILGGRDIISDSVEIWLKGNAEPRYYPLLPK